MMYGYNYGYGAYPFHMFGSLFMALFWVILLIIVIRALRGNRHRRPWMWHEGSDRKPVDILKERYAKGELTKEQFHEMKRELE